MKLCSHYRVSTVEVLRAVGTFCQYGWHLAEHSALRSACAGNKSRWVHGNGAPDEDSGQRGRKGQGEAHGWLEICGKTDKLEKRHNLNPFKLESFTVVKID